MRLKSLLKIALLGTFSLIVGACQMAEEDAPRDTCAGLQRQMTALRNTNSYNAAVIQSRLSALKKEYAANQCKRTS